MRSLFLALAFVSCNPSAEGLHAASPELGRQPAQPSLPPPSAEADGSRGVSLAGGSAATSDTSQQGAEFQLETAALPYEGVPPPLPAFEIEPPYLPGQRPGRPSGLVAASVADEEIARWNIGGSGDPSHPSSHATFHPAVRVVVETRALRPLPKVHRSEHVLTHGRLLARARKVGYWPFRACFEASLRRNPEAKGGKTRLRISIVADGRVSAARLLATEHADRVFASCMLRASKQLDFTPTPLRRLDVDVSVELWPGDAPLPPVAADVTPARLDLHGVTALIAGRASELGACCASGLHRDPKLWGRAALRVSTDGTGRVARVREDESRYPDPNVVRCWEKELAGTGPLASPSGPLDYIIALRCGAPPPSESASRQ